MIVATLNKTTSLGRYWECKTSKSIQRRFVMHYFNRQFPLDSFVLKGTHPFGAQSFGLLPKEDVSLSAHKICQWVAAKRFCRRRATDSERQAAPASKSFLHKFQDSLLAFCRWQKEAVATTQPVRAQDLPVSGSVRPLFAVRQKAGRGYRRMWLLPYWERARPA